MTPLQRHLERVVSLGCVVCRNEGLGETPASPHHPHSGGKRIHAGAVIPLCFAHHQSGLNDPAVAVSRHPHHRAFEAAYGTEAQLLAQTEREIEARYGGGSVKRIYSAN